MKRRPKDWPRHMEARQLANGQVAYYWRAPPWARALKAGASNDDVPVTFELSSPLGTKYGDAIDQAKILNARLDDLRLERGGRLITRHSILKERSIGSIDWLCDQFCKHRLFKKISAKQQNEYRKNLQLACDIVAKTGQRFGTVLATKVEPKHADQLFERLKQGPNGPRPSRAAATMAALRRAWNVGHRINKDLVPKDNPFEAMELSRAPRQTIAATLDDLAAYVEAADRIGLSALGTAAMIAYFWIQREPDIVHNLTWGRYKAGFSVDLVHRKTKKIVPMPLTAFDRAGNRILLFPELEARIARHPRQGNDQPIVCRDRLDSPSGKCVPYSVDLLLKHDRKIRNAAGLAGRGLTFTSFRHGGHTEAGDAGATDRELMATGGRSGASNLARYVKVTEAQARNLAQKRLEWRSSVLRQTGTPDETSLGSEPEQKSEWR